MALPYKSGVDWMCGEFPTPKKINDMRNEICNNYVNGLGEEMISLYNMATRTILDDKKRPPVYEYEIPKIYKHDNAYLKGSNRDYIKSLGLNDIAKCMPRFGRYQDKDKWSPRYSQFKVGNTESPMIAFATERSMRSFERELTKLGYSVIGIYKMLYEEYGKNNFKGEITKDTESCKTKTTNFLKLKVGDDIIAVRNFKEGFDITTIFVSVDEFGPDDELKMFIDKCRKNA